jgi:hypothetical protein
LTETKNHDYELIKFAVPSSANFINVIASVADQNEPSHDYENWLCEISRGITMKITVLWDAMLCGVVDRY